MVQRTTPHKAVVNRSLGGKSVPDSLVPFQIDSCHSFTRRVEGIGMNVGSNVAV